MMVQTSGPSISLLHVMGTSNYPKTVPARHASLSVDSNLFAAPEDGALFSDAPQLYAGRRHGLLRRTRDQGSGHPPAVCGQGQVVPRRRVRAAKAERNDGTVHSRKLLLVHEPSHAWLYLLWYTRSGVTWLPVFSHLFFNFPSGISARMSQARTLVPCPSISQILTPSSHWTVGLGIDCSPWVEAGLITHAGMLDRNWALWATFCQVHPTPTSRMLIC